jgi:hypothetical protein
MSYMDDRLKRKNGILPPLPTKKGKKALNKVSPKKKQEIAQLKNSGDDKLDDFFNEMKNWLRDDVLFAEITRLGKIKICGALQSLIFSQNPNSNQSLPILIIGLNYVGTVTLCLIQEKYLGKCFMIPMNG